MREIVQKAVKSWFCLSPVEAGKSARKVTEVVELEVAGHVRRYSRRPR